MSVRPRGSVCRLTVRSRSGSDKERRHGPDCRRMPIARRYRNGPANLQLAPMRGVCSLHAMIEMTEARSADLITPVEAAALLRVSPSTVRRIVASGELVAMQLGGHRGRAIRISVAALSAQLRGWEARG
jgi:excisionase family DNA binding protein